MSIKAVIVSLATAALVGEFVSVALESSANVDEPATVQSPTSSPEPERDDANSNDPEIQDPEIQEAEINDPELENPEPNNPEIQNPEQQEAEIQEAEIQNPEIDDPDPSNITCPPGFILLEVSVHQRLPIDQDLAIIVCTLVP